MSKITSRVALVVLLLASSLAAMAEPFTIVAIPDTQNYVDYTHQKSAGFPLEGADLFLEQMRYIAAHAQGNGGDIAFAIGLGDMWQHESVLIDPGHANRGFKRLPKSGTLLDDWLRTETRTFEIPLVAKGYGLLAGKLPFSVVPGNHDFDSQWFDADYPPNPALNSEVKNGVVLVGGLESFRSVFGPDSGFFKGKPWFVGSSPSGGDTAYVFEAGGYRFLQIGFQYEPPTESLIWAQGILQRYRGLPTIVSTHAYLQTPAQRINGFNPDLQDNNAEVVWTKFISQNDQIFLVLSGHWCTQAHRRDTNRLGHAVDQVLSDYQCRWQALKDVNAPAETGALGLGDGWLRLMRFDLDAAVPGIHVRTYSTHYKAFSSELPTYAEWYKKAEWPTLDDQGFLRQDDFVLELEDFRQRFAAARVAH